MAAVSAIFLVLAVWLAVLLGPQLSCWTWGASLLALGLAVVAALPGLWRGRVGAVGGGWMTMGIMVVGWFAWRAWASPVAELGMMDLLLLASGVGGFVVMRAMQDRVLAERVFLWGLGLLVLASVVVVARQVGEPEYTPGFVLRFKFPSGFFGHYNYCANFLIGSSCLIGGAALVGHHGKGERVIWGLIAVAGMVAVYFTRSRGGISGSASGMAVFAVMALIIGKQRGARWFAPGIVAVPLIGFVVAVFLLRGWEDAQEIRNQAAGIDVMMDNTCRLHLIGIAASCIGLHPWAGGGSRSFSWECYRFWEMDMHGPGQSLPEQVHNEFLQAAADYGLIGAGLIGIFLSALVVRAVIRTLFADPKSKPSHVDSWQLGGVAGLAGILVQSNFSFVFHMVPGTLMLGICLGRTAYVGDFGKSATAKHRTPAVIDSALALACAVLLVLMGWKGLRVISVRWADAYGQCARVTLDAKIAALTQAIRLWPRGEFYHERGQLYQQQAERSPHGPSVKTQVKHAMDDFREASVRHPFAPGPVVNRANLLGWAGKDAEALGQFDLAIILQGGMEAGFKSGYSKAAYLRPRAERLLAMNQVEEALVALLGAREALVKGYDFRASVYLEQNVRDLRIKVAERLGVLLSMAGRDQEAEDEFENAAAIYGGTGICHLHAYHLRIKAERLWYERKPSEALGLFLKARRVVDGTANLLPGGVTVEDQSKLRKELDDFIQYLKGAKIEASETPGK